MALIRAVQAAPRPIAGLPVAHRRWRLSRRPQRRARRRRSSRRSSASPRLPAHEYDRRAQAPRRSGSTCASRPWIAAVEAIRDAGADRRLGGKGRLLDLPEPEPWGEAVNGAELLAGIIAQIQRFVILVGPCRGRGRALGDPHARARCRVHLAALDCVEPNQAVRQVEPVPRPGQDGPPAAADQQHQPDGNVPGDRGRPTDPVL